MRTDIQIQTDVHEELRWEPSLDAAQIGVAVHKGIVTLTGTVPSYVQRVVAQHVAERIHGVTGIANELGVRLPGSRERTDADIAKAAVDAMRWRTTVSEEQVKIAVSKGWLTLEGSVEWYFQKASAEESVRHLLGVKGVTNMIMVKPRVTAADVKSRIEAALRRSAEVDARRIQVEAHEGRVTLRGDVPTWAERQVAERSAWAAPGTVHVENLITITPTLS
jgi:osmotically-inducible protein OsmY